MDCALSAIDAARFGWRIAKAKLSAEDDVAPLLRAAADAGAQMVIVRVPTDALAVAQRLEAAGAQLSDCLVYYQKKKIDAYPDSMPEGYEMALATASDSKEVEALARRTFAGYFGHYHADPRLGRDDCDAVYSSWAGASCTDKAVASDVILLRKSGSLAAFATIKQHSDIDFEGVLFGVSPDHQGKGLYPQLMQLTQNWGAARNLRRLLVSTQVTNVTVQKAWCRAGLEPMNSFYTFHLWLVPLPQ